MGELRVEVGGAGRTLFKVELRALASLIWTSADKRRTCQTDHVGCHVNERPREWFKLNCNSISRYITACEMYPEYLI